MSAMTLFLLLACLGIAGMAYGAILAICENRETCPHCTLNRPAARRVRCACAFGRGEEP